MATETENAAIAQAFNVLKTAMAQDHQYAWSWHCNIAMGFYDAGGDHLTANKGAARFMRVAFEVDVEQFVEYQDILQKYAGTP